MWVDVIYKEELTLGTKVRVKRTKHEAVISKVVTENSYGYELHCICYHIEPRDPKDLGGHWFFSHDFEKLS